MSADYDELLSARLKGAWTRDDESRLEAYLRDHPENRARWMEDLQMARLIRELPDVPVSSNFTARVIAELSEAQQPRRFLPRIGWKLGWAFAPAAALLLGLLAYEEARAVSRRELARGISTVSDVAALLTPPTPVLDMKGRLIEMPPMPGLDILRDFSVISRLGTTPQAVDVDLLAALQ